MVIFTHYPSMPEGNVVEEVVVRLGVMLASQGTDCGRFWYPLFCESYWNTGEALLLYSS